jgi:hypothetical protein
MFTAFLNLLALLLIQNIFKSEMLEFITDCY